MVDTEAARAKLTADHFLETYRSMIAYGQLGIRFVLLSNGGAAIALLAFAGDATAKFGRAPAITAPMILFVFGVFAGGVCVAAAYLTQYSLYAELLKNEGPVLGKPHPFWFKWALYAGVCGILLFGLGALAAVRNFACFNARAV